MNIDHFGLNIAVISSLSMYHLRNFLYFVPKHTQKIPLKNLTEGLVHGFSKYQFELLSILPYVMTHSGSFIKDYNAYASYNPPCLMVLLGLSFGNYKHMVDKEITDPFQPPPF